MTSTKWPSAQNHNCFTLEDVSVQYRLLESTRWSGTGFWKEGEESVFFTLVEINDSWFVFRRWQHHRNVLTFPLTVIHSCANMWWEKILVISRSSYTKSKSLSKSMKSLRFARHLTTLKVPGETCWLSNQDMVHLKSKTYHSSWREPAMMSFSGVYN